MIFLDKRKSSISEITLALFFFIMVLIFSFYGLERSFSCDEALSLFWAKKTFPNLISSLKIDSSAPLYFLILSQWIKVFGTGEVWVRLLSALFYCLNIPLFFILARTIYDKKTAFSSSVLFLISPLAINASQNARPYALLNLIVTASMLFFYKGFFERKDSKRSVLLFILTNAIGIFVHYWFIFVIAAQCISVVLFQKSRLKEFMAAILISIVPFTFWFPVFWEQAANPSYSWIPKPTAHQLFLAFITIWDVKVYTIALFLLTVHICRSSRKLIHEASTFTVPARSSSMMLVIFFLSTLLIPYCVSQIKSIFVVGRYTIVALPSASLLFGRLLSLSFRKSLLVLINIVFTFYAFILIVIPRQIPEIYSAKLTAQYLVSHAKQGDILIFTSINPLIMDYYLDRMAPSVTYVKLTFPDEINQHPGYEDTHKLNDRNYLIGIRREAEELIDRISSLPNMKNRTIWFFDGFFIQSIPETEILKEKLDQAFRRVKKIDLKYFVLRQVLVYKTKT